MVILNASACATVASCISGVSNGKQMFKNVQQEAKKQILQAESDMSRMVSLNWQNETHVHETQD